MFNEVKWNFSSFHSCIWYWWYFKNISYGGEYMLLFFNIFLTLSELVLGHYLEQVKWNKWESSLMFIHVNRLGLFIVDIMTLYMLGNYNNLQPIFKGVCIWFGVGLFLFICLLVLENTVFYLLFYFFIMYLCRYFHIS